MLPMFGRLSGSLLSTLAVCEPSSDSQSGSGLKPMRMLSLISFTRTLS